MNGACNLGALFCPQINTHFNILHIFFHLKLLCLIVTDAYDDLYLSNKHLFDDHYLSVFFVTGSS